MFDLNSLLGKAPISNIARKGFYETVYFCRRTHSPTVVLLRLVDYLMSD